jgi:hypothetical protein
MRLVARQPELRELGALATDAAGGHGGAMLVVGEAGIGKSTLVEAAVESLDGWRVLRASGVEFESELPYAALRRDAVATDHRRRPSIVKLSVAAPVTCSFSIALPLPVEWRPAGRHRVAGLTRTTETILPRHTSRPHRRELPTRRGCGSLA